MSTRARSRHRRNRVAIYMPRSGPMYERHPLLTGGAERQMTLLAQSLSANGIRVAHIVFPPGDPVIPEGHQLELVGRGPSADAHTVKGQLLEAVRIWRALRRADADIYVFRGSAPALGVGGLFCRMYRRHLVFSSANDFDFTLERMSDRPHRSGLYRFGVRSVSALVVQSEQQLAMARDVFPTVPRTVVIPSFGEPPQDLPPKRDPPLAFLWIGRLIEYKQPPQFLELARQMPDLRFWMIGVDRESDPVAHRVRAEAAELPNLQLLDPAPHAPTMELISQAVALVSTSRLEGMPNVFLEAWNRGIPVLSLEFDPDGVIERERLGIAANGSWERFVEGARALWDDGPERAEAGLRGRDYVRKTYSPDAVARRWGDLLAELAPDRAHRGHGC